MYKTIEKEELPFELKICEDENISNTDINIEKSCSHPTEEIDEVKFLIKKLPSRISKSH